MPKLRDDLDHQNLVAALQMIAVEFRRYNDANEPAKVTTGEIEFGKASYTDRFQREQTERLHEALDPENPPTPRPRPKR